MQKTSTQNKMALLPPKKLLWSLGVPMIISMMLQALYNIVDSAFVGGMSEGGEDALNALTLAFPVQMLMVALAIGTGVGVNALLSKTLGQNDKEKASRIAGNAIFLGVVICVLIMLFGIFGVKAYIGSQTKNTQIAEMAVSYLQICCIISFGIVFFSIFEKLLQATGRSVQSTIAQISGAVTNIILDPILIYGLFGLPAMGVVGAAWATVIGQIVSFVLALFFHLRYNKEVKNKIAYIKPSGKIIKEIYSIGFAAIIAQALMSVMTYGINIILGNVNEGLVTAYGLYYKVQQFVIFAAFGLRDAITPVVSFAHGMRDGKRVSSGAKYGTIYTLAIMLAGTVIVEALASPLASLFNLSSGTQALTISAMRIISVGFVFAGFNIAMQGVFQALDGGAASLVISVCRQFLFVIPVAYGFSFLIKPDLSNSWLLWLTFVIAEVVSAGVAVFFMARTYKKVIKPLK